MKKLIIILMALIAYSTHVFADKVSLLLLLLMQW